MASLGYKTAIVYQNVSYVNCTLYTVVTVTSKDNMRLACVNDVLAGNCYYYSSQPKHMYELYISIIDQKINVVPCIIISPLPPQNSSHYQLKL